jgi:hypothetical protein
MGFEPTVYRKTLAFETEPNRQLEETSDGSGPTHWTRGNSKKWRSRRTAHSKSKLAGGGGGGAGIERSETPSRLRLLNSNQCYHQQGCASSRLPKLSQRDGMGMARDGDRRQPRPLLLRPHAITHSTSTLPKCSVNDDGPARAACHAKSPPIRQGEAEVPHP